jgi:hypothetical protein
VTETWSFRPGLLEADASVKGYELDATDGHAGTVAWACYAPGESYLMVTVHHHLHGHHHVVPAGAVNAVDTASKRVQVRLARDDIEQLPSHYQDPEEPFVQPPSDLVEVWDGAIQNLGPLGAD